MSKNKFVSAALIVVLLVSASNLFGILQVRTVSGSPQNRITLPFTTGFENGEPHGKTTSSNPVDWKTANFYGYSGSGSSPLLSTGTASPAPPSNGYNFGSVQMVAEGNFGGPGSYCYFDLFDQTSESDWGTPIQLQDHTYISVWYCHTTSARCCMIDGELYNARTGQWWSLRDFTPDGTHFIVDQNNVRIHPAARRYDSVGTWNYSCFDLSLIYNNDPGNWYLTKIWVGIDNDNRFNVDGGPVHTGPARTYFDILQITYGKCATASAALQAYGFSGTTGQISASVVANSWSAAPQGSGYKYLLYLKATFISNSSGPYWSDIPDKSTVNVTNYPIASPFPASKPTINGLNLATSKADPSPPYKDWTMFGFDGLMLALSAPCLGLPVIPLLAIQAGELAVQLFGLLYNPAKPTYTYKWPNAETSNPNYVPSVTAGQVYIEVPIATSGNIPLSIDFRTEFWYVYWDDGGMEWHWVQDKTVTTHIDLTWTTPDINTNPSSGSPSVTLNHPSFADTTPVQHVGNPSWSDCNMQVTMNGQGPVVFVGAYATVTIRYYGNIWARPGSSGNIMFAVLGIDDTPLSVTGGSSPGVYPGGGYDTTFAYSLPYSYGIHNLYGIAAATYTSDQAKQQYVSYPYMRFLVGMIDINGGYSRIFLHGGNVPVSASVSPPPCYLLNPQPYNGQNYYASCYLTDLSWDLMGNTCYLTCTQPTTQSKDTGGVFTGTIDLTGLMPNYHYVVYIHAVGTNGVDSDEPRYSHELAIIYYYDNPPWTPWPPSASMYGNANTYSISTATTDPEGDNIYYQIDWGDGNITQPLGPYASGAGITQQHTWGSMTTYTVKVRAEDAISFASNLGLWSAWSSTTINVHNPTLSISISGSGTTNPAPGTYPYSYGTPVTVRATATSGYYFAYWGVDGGTNTSNPITVTMTSDHSLTAYFYYNGGGGGGCPILYTFDGKNYQCEGLLNIHNAAGTDVTTNHTLTYVPGRVDGFYNFEFIEHPETISHIDQVKLYAILQDGRTVTLPLVWAWHSEYGNVLPQLLFADGWKTIEYGANWNNGISQSIQMKFLALPPNVKVSAFVFQIKGCNMIVKT